MSEFKILSLNCRGLHDVNKRKDVFKYLREQKASLYCLQDTHCTENDKSVVYAQWGLSVRYRANFNQTSKEDISSYIKIRQSERDPHH